MVYRNLHRRRLGTDCRGMLMLSKLFKLPWPPGFFFPGCPCCIEQVTCATCTDSTLAKIWEFTISGVTNGSCSNCANDYNGTFQVTNVFVCRSNTSELTTCGSFTSLERYRLDILSGPGPSFGRLSSHIGLEKQSIWSNADFDCLGSNVLTQEFPSDSNDVCFGWPSTVTVKPI